MPAAASNKACRDESRKTKRLKVTLLDISSSVDVLKCGTPLSTVFKG